MLHNLTPNIKTIRLKVDGTNYTGSAGTSDLTSEAVDTQGYYAARFICGFGAITASAVTSTKLQQSTDDASSDAYADITGSAQTVADTDDNKVVISEIVLPKERYLKHIVDRGTANAVVDFLLVELIPLAVPVTQHSTVLGSEIIVSPAEGTA